MAGKQWQQMSDNGSRSKKPRGHIFNLKYIAKNLRGHTFKLKHTAEKKWKYKGAL